jgi:hypothetical protein
MKVTVDAGYLSNNIDKSVKHGNTFPMILTVQIYTFPTKSSSKNYTFPQNKG